MDREASYNCRAALRASLSDPEFKVRVISFLVCFSPATFSLVCRHGISREMHMITVVEI